MQNNPFLDAGENLSARQNAAGLDSQDFRLAAVYSVNQENTEVRLLLDGTSTPTQKYYKALTGAWPLAPDDRVIALKMSGTYVVVGKIGGKPDDPDPPTYIAAPHTVFAGPASGETSAEATFRALTKDDIPGGGGGEVEIVIAENVFTPNTGMSHVASKIAMYGSEAYLQFTVQVDRSQSAVEHTTDVYLLGTIAQGYRPATEITTQVAAMNMLHFTSGTEWFDSISSMIMTVKENGNVYVNSAPIYDALNPSPYTRTTYNIGYLLANTNS